jgi:hypothetical protein
MTKLVRPPDTPRLVLKGATDGTENRGALSQRTLGRMN